MQQVSGARWPLWSALLVGVMLRIGPLLRPLAVLDGRTLPDDTWLSLQIARNIGQGLGPAYSDGWTNGYQPLFVLLAAPFYSGLDAAALRDPAVLDGRVKLAILLVVLADLASGWLLYRLARRRWPSGPGPVLAAALWWLHPLAVRTSLNGLETSLAGFTLLLSVTAWDRLRSQRGLGPRLALGLCLGLGVLARIDQFFVGAWIFLALLWRHLGPAARRPAPAVTGSPEGAHMEPGPGPLVRDLLAIGAGFLAVYGPFQAWSYAWCGALYPVSGRAVKLANLAAIDGPPGAAFYARSLFYAADALFSNSPLLWGLTPGIVAALVLARTRGEPRAARILADLKSWALPLLFVGTLSLVYPLVTLGWWFYPRYLFLVWLAPLLLLATVVQHLAPTAPPSRLVLGAVLLAALISLPQPRSWQLLFSPPDTSRGYRPIGLWAQEQLEPGTVVAACQTGALAYYAPDLMVHNLDGVVNERAFRALEAHDLMGHVRAVGAEYVIGWQMNRNFMEHFSHDWDDAELPLVTPIEGFQSWDEDWFLWRVVPRSGNGAP